MRRIISFLAMAASVGGAVSARADSVLSPVADAFVSNYASGSIDRKNTNYGSASTVIVNNAGGIRVTYLRFDLRGSPAPVTALTLILTTNQGTVGNVLNVYGLTYGETWGEKSITWNNAPGIVRPYLSITGNLGNYLKPNHLYGNGAVLGTLTSNPAVGGIVTLHAESGPLIDFVNADADKIVTFMIAEADPSDGPGEALRSRESLADKPTLVVSSDLPPTKVLVVMLGGQSNADGRALASSLPTSPVNLRLPQEDVLYSCPAFAPISLLKPNGTQYANNPTYPFFGPEITLGRGLANSLAAEESWTQLAILKSAKGGTSLYASWKAGGTAGTAGDGASYQAFQADMAKGLASLAAIYPGIPIQINGMVWVQGERDIELGSTAVSNYGSNLTAFISDLRLTYGATLPFFYSRISSNQTIYSNTSSQHYPAYLTLRRQQDYVVANVPNTHMLDLDLPRYSVGSDGLHFGPSGQRALGAVFAGRMWSVLHLRITDMRFVSTGYRIRWNAIPGRSYTVSWSRDLETWTDIDVGVASQWIDTEPNGEPKKHYSVRES